jgi:hypothetical protein
MTNLVYFIRKNIYFCLSYLYWTKLYDTAEFIFHKIEKGSKTYQKILDFIGNDSIASEWNNEFQKL